MVGDKLLHSAGAGVGCFVGRERDLAVLRQLRQRARVLTLVGPAGVGKSRLASELLAEMTAAGSAASAPAAASSPAVAPVLPAVADVYRVDLGSAKPNGNQVAARVTAAFGVAEPEGVAAVGTVVTQVAAALAGRGALVLLDNCEHLADECAGLVLTLLGTCRNLSFLVTSREALRLPGEVVHPAAGLSQPHPGATSMADLLRSEAVRLFVERARESVPAFALTPANGPAVAEVCRRLDGLPLAIEMAARTVQWHSPAQLVDRLSDRFALLTAGAPIAGAQTAGAPMAAPRHGSLKDAIGWSYHMLLPEEQAAFRQLSVFAGSFGLDAAATVTLGPGAPAAAVSTLVTNLEAKSLLGRSVDQSGAVRFQMLESVRHYAHELLGTHGEALTAYEYRMRYLCTLAAPLLDGVVVPDTVLRSLRQWQVDLASAVARTGAPSRTGATADTATVDSRRLLLASALAGTSPGRLGRDEAEALLRQTLRDAGADQATDSPYLGLALGYAAELSAGAGRYAEARALAQQAVDRQRQRGGRPALLARLLRLLANTQAACGDRDAAVASGREGVQLCRDAEDQWGAAVLMHDLGWHVLMQGDLAQADRLAGESRSVLRSSDDDQMTGESLFLSGVTALVRGDTARASVLFTDALALVSHRSYRAARLLEAFGVLAIHRGQPERGLRLIAAAASGAVAPGPYVWGPWWAARVDRAERAAQARLGADLASAAVAAGARLTRLDAARLALHDSTSSAREVARPQLAFREREVAELTAVGHRRRPSHDIRG